jgi:hypothetical protein
MPSSPPEQQQLKRSEIFSSSVYTGWYTGGLPPHTHHGMDMLPAIKVLYILKDTPQNINSIYYSASLACMIGSKTSKMQMCRCQFRKRDRWASRPENGSLARHAANGIFMPWKKKNKTENLFSPYPRSVSDINWYTWLKIAMSCYLQGKLAINCRPTAIRKLAILPAYGRLLIL